MKGRYLTLATALAFFGYLNSANANIPRDINKDIDTARQEETLDKTLESDKDIILEQAKAAAKYISGTKWHDAGTIHVGGRFYLDLNKILGGKVKSTDVFSARYEVIDGEIDVKKTDKFYKSGKYPTIIPVNYELENGKKGRIILEVNIIEKP